MCPKRYQKGDLFYLGTEERAYETFERILTSACEWFSAFRLVPTALTYYATRERGKGGGTCGAHVLAGLAKSRCDNRNASRKLIRTPTQLHLINFTRE